MLRKLTALMLSIVVASMGFAQDKATGHKADPQAKHSITKKMPARDPKTGKFMKSTTSTEAVKTTTGKKMPARDPKTGRFMKKEPMMAGHKGMAARDPKTGRFIKKDGAAKTETTTKTTKKMPARDPKTGKFMKKGN